MKPETESLVLSSLTVSGVGCCGTIGLVFGLVLGLVLSFLSLVLKDSGLAGSSGIRTSTRFGERSGMDPIYMKHENKGWFSSRLSSTLRTSKSVSCQGCPVRLDARKIERDLQFRVHLDCSKCRRDPLSESVICSGTLLKRERYSTIWQDSASNLNPAKEGAD